MKRLSILLTVFLLSGCLVWYSNVPGPSPQSRRDDNVLKDKLPVLHYSVTAVQEIALQPEGQENKIRIDHMYQAGVREALFGSGIAQTYREDRGPGEHFYDEDDPGPFLRVTIWEAEAKVRSTRLQRFSQFASYGTLCVIPGYREEDVNIELSILVPDEFNNPVEVARQRHIVDRTTLSWILPVWIGSFYTQSRPDVARAVVRPFLKEKGHTVHEME